MTEPAPERETDEQLAKMLQDERDMLRVTMEHTNAHLAYLDSDFKFITVNHAYEQHCGIGKEELVGQAYFALFPNEEERAVFEDVRATGEAKEYKARALDPAGDGETTYWDWTLTPVKDLRGSVRGFVLSLVDVTETTMTARLAEAMTKIDAAMVSTRDPEQILRHAMTEAAQALRCDGCLTTRREKGSWLVTQVHGSGQDLCGMRMTDAQARHLVLAERTGEPVAVEDAYNDERANGRVMRRQRIRAILTAPFSTGGLITGALSFIHQERPLPFSPAHMDFARKLSLSVSLALENAHLYESLRNELSRVELLRQLALSSTKAASLEQVCTEMLSVLATQLHAATGEIRVLDRKQRLLRLVAGFGQAKTFLERSRDIDYRDGRFLSTKALRRRRPLTHEHDEKTPERMRLAKEAGLEDSRYIAVPLFYRGQIIGAFSLSFHGRRPFTEQELGLFSAVGHVVTQAVESARLFDAQSEAQQRAQYELDLTNLVLETSSALTSSLELNEILHSLTEIILKALDRSRVTIDLVDKVNSQLVVVSARGTRHTKPGDRTAIEDLSGKAQGVLRRKRSTVFDLSDGKQTTGMERRHREAGMRRLLVVPLVAAEESIGLVTVDQPEDDRPFSPREISLVEAIAAQAAIAIENARLHEESVSKARGLEAVSQMGSLITANLSLESAKDQIIDYSAVLLGATSSILLALDEEQNVFKVVAADGVPSKVKKKSLPLQAVRKLGLDGTAPVVIADLASVSSIPFFAANLRHGFVSAITAAIFIDNKLEGLIIIQDKERLSPEEHDLSSFRLFANQAATALKNARLYEEERRIAEILQHQLMRPIKPVGGLEVGSTYKAAFQAEQVGGDFYDVFELDGDLVAVLVGDVSGKGVLAAGLTETIKSSVRTLAYIDPSPSFVFSRLNHSLLRQTSNEMFATAILAVINIRTGDVRLSNAGHTPPVIHGAECHYLKTPVDTLLGAFQQPYREMYFKIDPEQLMLFYTDGITEARSGAAFFGERRLLRAVAACESEEPQRLVDNLLQSATDFAQGKLSDDVAVLALRLAKRPAPRQGRAGEV